MFIFGFLVGLVSAILFQLIAYKIHQKRELKKGNKLTYSAYVKGIHGKK